MKREGQRRQRVKSMKPLILVVDDDKFTRDAVEVLLKDSGYAVKAVSNAREAVDLVVENHIKLVIMDLYMEHMDGLEAIDRIRDVKPEIPIVVMTGDEKIETEREARARGVVSYFIKPIEEVRMKATVESIMRKD